MIVHRTILKSGRHEIGYEFRQRGEKLWAAHKDGVEQPYLINLKAGTCTCTAGRHGRLCKHRKKATELEQTMSTATVTASPAIVPPQGGSGTAPPLTNGQKSTQPTAIAIVPDRTAQLAELLVRGNLATLSEPEKAQYMLSICDACGLDPRTRPFEFINIKGKVVLYALKACSEQLRKRDRVTLTIVSQQETNGVYVVTVEACTPDGRKDTDIGVVPIQNMVGEDRSNAIMRAVTKAKRRVTLSICGLGMLDESEVESFPTEPARPVAHQHVATVVSPPPPTIVTTPAVAAAPVATAPSPAQQPQPVFDRMATMSAIEKLVSELNIPKLGENLQKAYGKSSLTVLLDGELADLHKRLSAKKAKTQTVAA